MSDLNIQSLLSSSSASATLSFPLAGSMDPLSVIAGSLGIAGQAISGLKAVWEFLKVCQQIDNAAEDAQIFVRQLRQVSEDFDYALSFRSCVQDRSRTQATMQDKWIYKVLMGTVQELDDFGRHVQKYDKDRLDELGTLSSFKAKVRFALKDSESLALRREGLGEAHSRLLTAIMTMHYMAPGVASPGLQLPTRPLSAPVGQMKRPKRASRMPSVEDDEDNDVEIKEDEAAHDVAAPILPAPPAYEKDLGISFD